MNDIYMTPDDQEGASGEASTGINVPTSEPKTMGYMKSRLFQDAEKITDRDVEELESAVPEKLSSPDLRELRFTTQWIGTMLDRVGTLFSMVRDPGFTISGKTKALIAAALLYFVLPTDIVPDFIPGIGYVDDALILTTLWNIIKGEVDAYLDYRQRKQSALEHV